MTNRNLNTLVLLIIYFGLTKVIYGQLGYQGAIETNIPILYWNQMSLINPSETGFDKKMQVSFLPQRYGTNSNNTNNIEMLDLRIESIKSAIGIRARQEFANYYGSFYDAAINYNFFAINNENSKLAFGISGGYGNIYVQGYQNYWSFGFPAYTSKIYSGTFGINYRFRNLKTGISLKYEDESDLSSVDVSIKGFSLWTVNLTFEYKFNLSKNWMLKPMLLGYYSINHWQYTHSYLRLTNLISYKNIPWIGIGIEGTQPTTVYLQFMMGLDIWKFRLGYGFDPTSGSNKNLDWSIHELTLSFFLD